MSYINGYIKHCRGVCGQNSVNSVCLDDWTVELVIIASNVSQLYIFCFLCCNELSYLQKHLRN